MTDALPRRRLLLFAPAVHTGGGLVLLQELLNASPPGAPLLCWLDARARSRLVLPAGAGVTWVMPRLFARLAAEFALARAGKPDDRLLCFHGLPPLVARTPAAQVFVQNRLHLGGLGMGKFGWRARIRLCILRALARTGRGRVAAYLVQSPSMARELRAWFGPGLPPVNVLPFAPPSHPAPRGGQPRWDFVYVADGEVHKNHRQLVTAWVCLARRGLRPSLALTLPPRHAALADWVARQAAEHDLAISNLGAMPRDGVIALYGQAGALIFPSLSESFGLPLIEAGEAALPIIAGELDYVRDICEPVQTFDPRSPVSIARAVARFLGVAEGPLRVADAGRFLAAVMDGPDARQIACA